jgi:hypothetical protein
MSYSILIKQADKNEKDINFWKSLGYEHVQLPDNQCLMVADDAPEDVMNAALDAGNGDFDAFKTALGIEDSADENP